MIKTSSKKSFSSLVKEADTIFSEVVRRMYAVNGWVKCFTCGKPMFWRDAHAGHVFVRGNMASRYDLQGAYPVCSFCNCSDPEHQAKIQDLARRRMGNLNFMALENRAHSTLKLMACELEELIEKLKEQNKELRKKF